VSEERISCSGLKRTRRIPVQHFTHSLEVTGVKEIGKKKTTWMSCEPYKYITRKVLYCLYKNE